MSSSVLTPILGKLGDAHGKKRLLVISLAIFALGEPRRGAGAEHRRGWSRSGRCRARARRSSRSASGSSATSSRAQKVGVAIGTISSVFGIGGGVGLVLSGVIVEHLSWHWLFLIGALPVLVATALIVRFVPESTVKTPAKPDYLGAARAVDRLRGAAARAERGHAVGLDVARACSASPRSRSPRSTGWVAIERRVEDPLVDLPTLLRPGMAATNATTVLVGFSMTAFFVLVPGFLQSPTFGFGLSPTEAGFTLLPFSAAMILAGPFAGSLGTRRGRVLPLRIGLALGAVSLAGLAAFHAQPARCSPPGCRSWARAWRSRWPRSARW